MSKPTIEHLVEAFALMQQQLDNLQKQVTLLGSHAFPSAPSDDECDEILS